MTYSNLRPWLRAFALAVAAVCLLGARGGCGDNGGVDEEPDAPACISDRECASNEVCVEGACVVEGGGDCICTEEYAPVCGADGQTYSNACHADCAGTTVQSEGECGGGGDCACAEIYMPVCGTDGQTYGNACEADCAGVRIASDGECGDPAECPPVCDIYCEFGNQLDANGCATCACNPPPDGACYSDADCAEGEVCARWAECLMPAECPGVCEPDEGCACPAVYDPVCGADGATYGNACEAGCAGVEVVSEGMCGDACEPVACEIFCEYGFQTDERGCEICACNPAPDDACYSDRDCAEGQICLQDTDCFAPEGCPGQCIEEEPGCICPDVYMPVCGTDGRTYGNTCEADCFGAEIAYEGACESTCEPVLCQIHCEYGFQTDEEGCEVCACNPPPEHACTSNADCREGEECVQENNCLVPAECPGVCRPAQDECICTEEYAPVCGADGVTYSNACHADCARAEIAYEGACEELCQCAAIHMPVCGADGQTYGNPCLAACAGVEVVHEGACESACEPVLCDLFCEHGFQTDENGCEVCACNPAPEGCLSNADCAEGEECIQENACFVPAECPGVCRLIPEECICPAVYMPVCGADGETYGNACEADCARAEIAYEGACR